MVLLDCFAFQELKPHEYTVITMLIYDLPTDMQEYQSADKPTIKKI